MNARVKSAWLMALMAGVTSGSCHAWQAADDLAKPARVDWLKGEKTSVAADGRSLPIVVDDNADNRWAAMFLARVIGETCGVRPDVFVERKGQRFASDQALFIGEVRENEGWRCELARVNADAFRVVAAGGSVHFVGRADFAVFDWCERELGMRFYCDNGFCTEPRSEIAVEGVDYSDAPAFECRQLGWQAADPWVRVAKGGSTHRGGVSVHQPHGWIREAAMRKHLHDIFENGETPMLCYGNPRTLDYYEWIIGRHIAGVWDSGGIVNTNRKVITVCQWDAPVRCQCNHCRPLYAHSLGEGGEASQIIWGRFLQGLSERMLRNHPDYEISFLPYLNTCEVPSGLKLPGNAEAEVCVMPGLAMLKNRRCKANEERILREWREVTGRKVMTWEYGCWPQERTAAPYVYGRTIRDHYADMREVACGSYICGGEHDARMVLSMYVWMKCIWNPEIDVEALYDGFARRMFASAAKPIRELIRMQENCWNRQWESDWCTHHNVFEVSYPRKDTLRMKELLIEAAQLAEKNRDETARQRIAWYASGFAEFFAESDNLAARKGRMQMRPGEMRQMVPARSAARTRPWATTEVTTAVGEGQLKIVVRCIEPGVGKMNFARADNDFVWGNDSVTFAIGGGDGIRTAVVDLTGAIENGWDGFSAKVWHDDASWTVEASIQIDAKAIAEGKLLGNVSRWRVGDRKLPSRDRIPGSCFEHSRLNTCYTDGNSDPAAFVEFLL